MSVTVQQLRTARGQTVKSIHKRVARALNRFYANQSLVGDPPVFATNLFPFLWRLEAVWRTIPTHHGSTKGVIVFHLPLILPAEWEKCFIRVAGHIYHWALHEAYAFDDTYDHGGAQRQKSAARGTDLPRHPGDALAGPDGQSSLSGRHTAQRVRPGSVMQPCAWGKPLRESNRSRTGVRRGWRSGHLLTPLCLPECG